MYEIAQKFERSGDEVSMVVLLDTWAPGSTKGRLWRRFRLTQNWISKETAKLRAGKSDGNSIPRSPIDPKAHNDLVRPTYKRLIGKLQNRYQPAPTTIPVALLGLVSREGLTGRSAGRGFSPAI